jgi:NAD(P)-dependent dehydrogenase (short-subunit alcohol dehydrogenase family)
MLNPPITRWDDKTVWIVGASSGIGLAIAHELIARKARVIISARRQEVLDQVSPPAFMALACDVSSPPSIHKALHALIRADALPQIVFWVAGVYHPMASDALDMPKVRETFDVNLLSAYEGQAAMIAAWQAHSVRSPHWIMVSSVAGYSGLPLAAAYGASKAAMTYLAETSFVELAPKGIAVSVVNPGFVATRLTATNSFAMPAMIQPHEAALATLDGLARGQFEIHYPKRFTRLLKLLRLLPYGIYLRIMRRVIPKQPA